MTVADKGVTVNATGTNAMDYPTFIKTNIVEPSIEGMGLLAAMIIIRTMLGWTTVLEINGRWPWQRR